MGEKRTPILVGESGARVLQVTCDDGSSYIEKHAPASEIHAEAAVLNWCAGRLPVPAILQHSEDTLTMTELKGVDLTKVPLIEAVNALADALGKIHNVPVDRCPFLAGWSIRLNQAKERMRCGLVDEYDFDEENLGRKPADIIAELECLPALPAVTCFTHGDACLQNFLSHQGQLTGIVDWGRAGVTHPAQDWALALRSMQSSFGLEGERMLRERMPAHCSDENLLRQFRLLDEFF